MTGVDADLATLREHLPTDYLGPDRDDPDGEKWGQHPEALAALARVEAELSRLREEERRLNTYIDQYILDVERLREQRDDSARTYIAAVASEARRAEAAEAEATRLREEERRLRRHPDAWSQEAFDQQKARAEAAEAEKEEWVARTAAASERWEAAEARCARLQTTIAQQLTPLDVAITHIDIIRRKRDDYTADERENVAAIVEHHAREARTALFEALAGPGSEQSSLTESGSAGLPDTPADSQEDKT